MKHKLFALLLTLCMVFSLLPIQTVMAEESNHWNPIPEDGVGGNMGEGLTWSLSADGVLTVSGNGAMPDYDCQSYEIPGEDAGDPFFVETTSAPWGKYGDNITAVVVEDGITCVGEFSFFGLCKVTSVKLPSTLTQIDPHSFQHMAGLTEIDLPDSVRSIGLYAFYSTFLKNLTIPAALEQLGAFAFTPGDNLYIDTLEHWLAIEFIPDEYGNYDWANPTAENTNVFIGGKQFTKLAIPEGTTEIQPYAFWNWDFLTEVTIPDTVTSIGEGAFWQCSGLTDVTIPDSVTYMGDKIFFECTGLQVVNLPATMYDVPAKMFSDCINLMKVDLPETVSTIQYAAFDGCAKLVSINENNSLENVLYIDGRAFCGCKNLEFGDLVLSENLYSLGSSYYGYSFAYCEKITSVTIPGNVYDVPWTAFSGCSNLKKVIVKEGVSVIDSSAFSDCSKLEYVLLPTTVERIEDYAFTNCPALKDLYILSDASIAEPSRPEFATEDYYPIGIPGITSIHARPDSSAAAYAKKYGFAFQELPQTCEYGYHTFDKIVTVESTCTEHGYEEISCSGCGKLDSYIILTCEGHNLADGTCTVCGDSFIATGFALNGNTDRYTAAWALSTDGTLTLFGTEMIDIVFMGVPWEAYADHVKTLVYGGNVVDYWLYYPGDLTGGAEFGYPEWPVFPNLTTVVIGPALDRNFSLYEFTAPNLSEIISYNDYYSVIDGQLYVDRWDEIWLAAYLPKESETVLRLPEFATGIDGAALKYASNLEKIYVDCDMIIPETFKDCTSLTDLYILNPDWTLPSEEMEPLCASTAVTLHGVPGSMTQKLAEALGHKFLPLTECDINGHGATVIKDAKDATCMEEGYSGDTYCSICNELLYKGEVIDLAAHTLTAVAAVPATCLTDGIVAYWSCAVCEKLFADANASAEITDIAVPAVGHIWNKGTEADGVKVFHCDNCEETKTQILPPEGMDVALPELSDTLQSSVLTEEEQQRVESGEPLDIYLDVADISQTVPESEKELISEKLGDHKVGVYLDINLYKQIGSDQPVKITETSDKVQITIKIPDELLNSDPGMARSYRIIRVHEGVAEVIEGTFSKDDQQFTFETDGFSTYVLTYVDVEQAPNTGDGANILLWGMLSIASMLAMLVICNKKKQYN